MSDELREAAQRLRRYAAAIDDRGAGAWQIEAADDIRALLDERDGLRARVALLTDELTRLCDEADAARERQNGYGGYVEPDDVRAALSGHAGDTGEERVVLRFPTPDDAANFVKLRADLLTPWAAPDGEDRAEYLRRYGEVVVPAGDTGEGAGACPHCGTPYTEADGGCDRCNDGPEDYPL